jgi:hypothetical protein
MGLDTKTYWLTGHQSQCDFDFDLTEAVLGGILACKIVSCINVTQRNKWLCEIVNKPINNLNGVLSGITRHNIYWIYQWFKAQIFHIHFWQNLNYWVPAIVKCAASVLHIKRLGSGLSLCNLVTLSWWTGIGVRVVPIPCFPMLIIVPPLLQTSVITL